MDLTALPPTNFAFLRLYDEQFVRLGMLAEKYFAEDPNTCLLKIRQFAELLAQEVAARTGQDDFENLSQYDLLRLLQDKDILTREVYQVFGEIRRMGNAANHAVQGDHQSALTGLKLAWQLGIWFHRTFKNPNFKSGAFIPPPEPQDQTLELRDELQRLKKEVQEQRQLQHEASQNLEFLRSKLQEAESEQSFWQQMAHDADQAKSDLAKKLAEQQPTAKAKTWVKASRSAAHHLLLDEASTRQLIDQQLCQAGWEADTTNLRYARGTRPQKGRNLAIAEYPTESGPADYVLFIGLMPVAAVEAKRKNKNVSASLQQAQRYSRAFKPGSDMTIPSEQEYRLPFVFSTNGRPYLRQMETLSGIWFQDLRRKDNLAQALDGWHTPQGLIALLKHDPQKAHQQLASEPFDFGFNLRPYQQQAIQAIEGGLVQGKRAMLLAMATGTGKTKTCIALIYRLLKAQRFQRVLFLVDREALGEQAANAFKDTRMDSIQTFANIFKIMELDEQTPDTNTAVHVATVQGMVRRILLSKENQPPPPIDRYDCIVVDECHRGYLLDRELSDTELTFRSYEDYISKYRRVLDYFDAVKIGLTATPALQTTQIFGEPIFTYSYREAVIDGYLVDHEPPVQLTTELAKNGITWVKNAEVMAFHPHRNQIELFKAPDEIHIDVDGFNKKVVSENFNRVICEHLAHELDPTSRQKTLIFCANDAHADQVVMLLKQAFQARYGSVEDDAVLKITGNADNPLGLIRKYKNERNPNVAVTVDLLTTGVDVPAICNLVFLRRVNSRILFEQMLGRATRLCDEIDKQSFRIFDAVRLYEALQDMTAMQPVVQNPSFTFTQLIAEFASTQDGAAQNLIREQLLARLQRRKRKLVEEDRQDLQAAAGLSPEELIRHLRQMPLPEITAWFVAHSLVSEILDRDVVSERQVLISEHPDRLINVEHGYGDAQKPQDYLDAFKRFIQENQDKIPALMTVLTRPQELTRQDLRQLAMELDKAGFSEVNLQTAWRELKNEEIAARIVGFIRHIATGDPLVPFASRVDWALQQMLAARAWTNPQRDWLKRIAAQTKANQLVDLVTLNDRNQIFTHEGGGFKHLDRIFDGKLVYQLNTFNDLLWDYPDSGQT